MIARRTKIYFDGGCRPNPGPLEDAVVTGGVAMVERDIGVGSSLDAEWLALIAALRLARERGFQDFVLLGDAAAVIAQATDKVRAPGRVAGHLAAFRALAGEGATPRVRHIGRAQNLAGFTLAKLHPR